MTSALLTDTDIVQNRARFNEMESRLLSMPQLREADYKLREYVSGGMYCRQITIPKGAAITGRIYKFDHVEIMLSGDITILAADGGEKRYTGHRVIEAQSGKRQAGLAHEDTEWLTINRVPNIPLSDMLDWTSVLTYEEYHAFHEDLDRQDYAIFLNELGLTQDQMDQVVMTDDVIQMPDDFAHVVTRPSKRGGLGLFSEITLRKGDVICPARIGNNRTIAGRYTNHGFHANSRPYLERGLFLQMALRDIPAGDEITINYRDVLKFRQSAGDAPCQVG